jgi:hypothetical protein
MMLGRIVPGQHVGAVPGRVCRLDVKRPQVRLQNRERKPRQIGAGAQNRVLVSAGVRCYWLPPPTPPPPLVTPEPPLPNPPGKTPWFGPVVIGLLVPDIKPPDPPPLEEKPPLPLPPTVEPLNGPAGMVVVWPPPPPAAGIAAIATAKPKALAIKRKTRAVFTIYGTPCAVHT